MSEAKALQYSHEQFPFSAVLDELTELTYTTEATPLETYLYYRRLRRDAKLTPCPDYASTSITSGGHARRPGLSTYQIINANTDTARRLVVELADQGTFDDHATILPVDLGYFPHWKQSDYMHFWSLIIGGPDLGIKRYNQSAARYLQRVSKKLDRKRVDMDKMNDPLLPANERALEYFKFAEAFANAIDQTDDATPVRSVINLVDPELSLGCQTERLLAKMLCLPVKLLVPVRVINQYDKIITDHKLKEDLDVIVRFGGTVVEAAKGSMLTLKTVKA